MSFQEKKLAAALQWDLKHIKTICVNSGVDMELTKHMKRAKDIGEEMFAKYPERTLLHGDLHHDNILLNANGDYSMIDPKGIVGPRIFDLPRFIMNELDPGLNTSGKSHIDLVIHMLSESLHYTADE